MSPRLVIIDSQQNKFEVELDKFIKFLHQALSANQNIVLQLPMPKYNFHFPHPDPLGSIIVFKSKINFAFAPAYSVFPFMWAKEKKQESKLKSNKGVIYENFSHWWWGVYWLSFV